jgi:hypothetical protein
MIRALPKICFWMAFAALSLTLETRALLAQHKRLDDMQLTTAETAFKQGFYDRCKKLLADQEIQDIDPQLQARFALIKARLGAVYEDQEGMMAWLTRLAQLDPGIKLNRYTDPPQLMEAWEEIRLSFQGKLDTSLQVETDPPPEVGSEKSPLKRSSHEIVSLFPLGIGSFHHGEYTRGLLFTLLDVSLLHLMTQKKAPFAKQDAGNSSALNNRMQWFAVGGLAASWGYQTHAILESDSGRGLATAPTVRQVHAFMPFGLGQIQNREYNKGFAFAAAEAVLFLYASMEEDPDKQKLAYYLAWGTIFYGAFDGWYHYEPGSDKLGSYHLSPHIEATHVWSDGDPELVTGFGAALTHRF